ncbi:MAG: hypothetical protein ACOCU8_00155 [Patescibacteria group bacterium]
MNYDYDLLTQLSNLVPASYLWLAWLGIFIFTLIISVIFVYHWRQFGMKNNIVRLAELIYLIVTGLLLILSAIMILVFSLF